MCGRGYDGVSNMRGEFHGLQTLFLEECPYAYYVHCFAHRLQLTLNAVAMGVNEVWEFISKLNLLVTFVDSSAKRHFLLKIIREEEIEELIVAGRLETCRGANQTTGLQRAGATRWGSHHRSISSLIKLYKATRLTLADLKVNGEAKVRGQASSVGKIMKDFDFVFCLLLMDDIMKIVEFLCQALQKKAIEILNALRFLTITKSKLQAMREDDWDTLIAKVISFCEEHDVVMPDMCDPYMEGVTPRTCQQRNFITNEHFYRVNILNAVIDLQLAELENRFTETSLELLILSATLDLRDNFQAFKTEDVRTLVVKFYPQDFIYTDILSLEIKCAYYLADIQMDRRFNMTPSLSDLCQLMIETRKSAFFSMIYKLICLVLTLPVSTATTERALSSMKILKNTLRNKMGEEFLDDSMVLYIEREYAESIDNNSVVAEFEVSGPRRVRFS